MYIKEILIIVDNQSLSDLVPQFLNLNYMITIKWKEVMDKVVFKAKNSKHSKRERFGN